MTRNKMANRIQKKVKNDAFPKKVSYLHQYEYEYDYEDDANERIPFYNLDIHKHKAFLLYESSYESLNEIILQISFHNFQIDNYEVYQQYVSVDEFS